MYEHHAPGKLAKRTPEATRAMVDAALRRSRGDEEGLLAELLTKYGPEPPQH